MKRLLTQTTLAVLLVATGGTLRAQPDFAAAVEEQRLRVEAEPTAAHMNDLGGLLLLAGERTQAQLAFEQALVIEPDNQTSLYNLGVIVLEEDPGWARKLLKSALEQSEDGWTHYRLAQAYERLHQRRFALKHYTRAFDLDRSLLYPEVNPEIIGNQMAIEALLNANTEVTALRISPRFVEVDVMRSMLLEEEEAEASEVESEEPEINGEAIIGEAPAEEVQQ